MAYRDKKPYNCAMQDGAHTLRSLTLFVSSHFMFNVLGKLQSEILSGEKRGAISTLTLYSRLLRQACNFGTREKIPLTEEGLFLENYLKLEKDRFHDTPFEYLISGFDHEDIFIQPFLIQPFLELSVLGSLGRVSHKTEIEFNKAGNFIRIDSVMLNTEIHDKLTEKCDVARQRLEFFNHNYQISKTETRYLQKISLDL